MMDVDHLLLDLDKAAMRYYLNKNTEDDDVKPSANVRHTHTHTTRARLCNAHSHPARATWAGLCQRGTSAALCLLCVPC